MKFEPIAQGPKGKGIAKEVIHYYKELYKIERGDKNSKMTAQKRYELRQKKSKLLIGKFKLWLYEVHPVTLPQSVLEKAVNDTIKLLLGLTKFLEDGRLEIDNNLTEKQIKSFVIAWKNFLFACSVDGAHALWTNFSFIRTAKQHGFDHYYYYVKLLKNLLYCKSIEYYKKL
jgi:transposase